MRVKAPPLRLIDDSLSAHTDQARFLESEAGNRAQSDIRCGVTLALTGGSHLVKQSLEKQLTFGRSTQYKARLNWRINPAVSVDNSGKSPGIPVVEMATPNGTNNLTEGTNKNELEVKEGSLSK